MPHRYRPALLLPALLGLIAALAAPASAAPDPAVPGADAAVAYQIGVSHDGYSPDTSIAPPLTSEWSDKFAGGVSYPLIADGKVFVTVADSGGSYGTTLYALSPATGATAWSQPISGTYNFSNAAYDSGQVFVLNFDGLLRAFNAATGTLSWSVQLPGQSAFYSPPTAAGGLVYVSGSGYGGTTYAVSETSGAVVWSQEVGNPELAGPALSGKSVFTADSCGLVYAYALATGQQQWVSNSSCQAGAATPVFHNAQVYARIGSGNRILDAGTGQRVGTFKANPAPAFDGQVGLFLNHSKLTASSGGTTDWTFTGDGGLDTAPIAVAGTAYVGSSSGMLYGLDINTGAVVWSTNVGTAIPAPNDGSTAAPLNGLSAGHGLLIVPAGDQLTAYGG
jgi:outer membrane protein assembly factor BamB